MTSLRQFLFMIALCAILIFPTFYVGDARAAELELREGDRVVLLGATFIERMQAFGYLEAALTARYPQRNLTFRNLGWSADTVSGISRAVFGKPEDGFKRLVHDVTLAKPTVIVVAYGANEAFAGAAGLPDFQAGLNHLLDALRALNARLVLISPPERENLGPPLPDPAAYNAMLGRYLAAARTIAAERKISYCDLGSIVSNSSDAVLTSPLDRLTENGIHRTPYGHWRAAPVLAARLGHRAIDWQIDLNVARGVYEALGTAISDVQMSANGVSLNAQDLMLPPSPPPRHAPKNAHLTARPRIVRISGLAKGTYELRANGEVVARASDQSWAKGVSLRRGPQFKQAEALRQAILEKNELFFYRHRPQNETYLFLFRKHEQGNNAAEVPQFDPLIEKHEQVIAQLCKPKAVRYELRLQ